MLSTFYAVWNVVGIQQISPSLLLSLFSEILSLFTNCRFESILRSVIIKKSTSWVGLFLFPFVYRVVLKNELK